MLPEPPPLGSSMLPAGSLRDEVVVVTGGGTGLGKAIAVEFARLGASVAVMSRDPGHREAGVAAVTECGAKAVGVQADVRDPEQIAAAFDDVERALGPVTSLVNNASGNFPAAAERLSPNGWRAVLGIVLDGTYYCSTEFARRRMTAGAGGSILNILATKVWSGGPAHAHNSAAKAGVWNLTMSLAVEWAPYGIRVNAIAPGLFLHPDQARLGEQHTGRAASEAEAAGTIPAGRVGRPHELAWAATYLCSPYAAYVTGQSLVIDGANWLRRERKMPPFRPIHEVLGLDD
ncbi:MAG TPA: SDR family oxidoreductase [Amycolatopsis sp.]|nr:SDR family oxidoreductase [Amycolatopsis sp.]